MNEIDFININQPLNLEQELGNGYIKLTDRSFNEGTGNYHIESEILDESHHMIGNFTIDAYIYNLHMDDYNVNTKLCMEVDFKGDVRKINSLLKDI
ncbi:MAG: hypothetical protein LBJ80_01400 [Rickettsiales bacterium]|jgi:hypothetical protein|nr:hypothetical protein [Rickettsiales bacterium]MDR1261064.1 hypothetical protein [Rickettsiales bacterium]